MLADSLNNSAPAEYLDNKDLNSRCLVPAFTTAKGVLLVALILTWLGAVVVAFETLHRYKTKPGPTGKTAENWPTASRLKPGDSKPTLVMFAHPQCPCTEATMTEFARLLTRTKKPPASYVVFVQPADVANAQTNTANATPSRTQSSGDSEKPDVRMWEDSKLWSQARAIPGVTALLDRGGTEAKAFGAATSGHVFLFKEKGELVFSGGITDERGHAGDNPGEDSVVALLNNQPPLTTKTPVFGCPLDTE